MVGSFSYMSSPILDSSHTCPCLCFDTMRSKSTRKTKQLKQQVGSLELTTSFVDRTKEKLGIVKTSFSKQHKVRRSVIVSNLGGQYEDTFVDVKMQLVNYFTYKAARTVLNQLYEMNPPEYTWFYNFVVANRPGDGKLFLRNLGKENQDLAERVMVTRLHLYGKWVKKCDHAEIYQEISDENLELMRERLLEIVVWPSDDSNPDRV